MNPRLVQLNKLWDSLGTALGQTSLLMSTVTAFVPEKSKKIFFRPDNRSFSKINIRHVCCVSCYEYSTSVKQLFTPDRRIERNVDAAVLAPEEPKVCSTRSSAAISEAACRRQWPRIATSFTAWFRMENEVPEAACRRRFLCCSYGAPGSNLRPLSQGGGRGGLTLGYILASPTGTRIFAGFRLAYFAFPNRNSKPKERKGDAKDAKVWMRRPRRKHDR